MVKRIKHIFAPLCTFASVTALLTGCAGKQPENTPPTTAPIDGAAKPSSRIPTPAPASQAPVSAEPSTSAEVESYRDGSYAATGTYRSPAGEESVNVTLTLTKGVITAATYQGTATNQKSIMFQKKFGDAYEEQVVGKPINDLSLEVINGSSLTPAGFMNAVARIKVEAAGS